MQNRYRFLLAPLLLLSTFVGADDLDRQLQDKYANKTLMLRGFYSGEHLRYDSSGSMIGGKQPGDWTSDGFVLITDIGMKGHAIRIKARRMSAVSVNNAFALWAAENQNVRPGENRAIAVEITAELGTKHPSADQAMAAMAKVFLSAEDDFSSLVPDYWKPCVPAGLVGKDENCHFSSDILGVPGIRVSKDPSGIVSTTGEHNSAMRNFFAKNGISPPKLTAHKEPEFSDLARRMKYQGTAALRLTVNEAGVPTHVYVLHPLGCGLDAQAVRTVEGWRFTPAQKDGRPVAVEIAVEVDFRLY